MFATSVTNINKCYVITKYMGKVMVDALDTGYKVGMHLGEDTGPSKGIIHTFACSLEKPFHLAAWG